MKSNMSCLTKKSLFFIVLFIVCNPTFSSGTKECIANVHHVFKDMKPYLSLKFAMFSLSEKFFETINTTTDLANHIINEENSTFVLDDSELNKKHSQILDNFRFLVNWLEKNSSKSKYSWKSIKTDAYGYYRSLVSKLKNISWNNLFFAISPAQFCQLPGYEEVQSECISILAEMFRGKVDMEEAKEAFIFCYENYTHLDFTYEELTAVSSEFGTYGTHTDTSRGKEPEDDEDYSPPPTTQTYGTHTDTSRGKEPEDDEDNSPPAPAPAPSTTPAGIKAAYFSHMIDTAHTFATFQDKLGPNLFPTVEEYCATPRSSSSTT